MDLTTTRLALRPQAPADAPALFAILHDPEAMRFWNRPPVSRLAVVEETVREQQAAMAAGLCRYWTAWEGDDAIGSLAPPSWASCCAATAGGWAWPAKRWPRSAPMPLKRWR
jgi:RimJ/RimL family protein N-acetyltransferase